MSEPKNPRPRADTPVEVPQGKVYQPHYSAKVTKPVLPVDAFGAIQDLRAELNRRFDLYDKAQRELSDRTTDLERGQSQVSHNDLGQQKALAEALIRVKKLEEDLPKATSAAVQQANDKQTLDLKSSKLTEYLRLFGVVLGTALASYFASYRGSSEADQRKPVVIQAPAPPGLESK